MNKISYPQLVKDIADAYRNAIGSTDPITIGELANKVGEAISNGGGDSIHYKSITYNEDNTITLIDNDNVEHTINYLYENGNIKSVSYDNEDIPLNYKGDNTVEIGGTITNLFVDEMLSQISFDFTTNTETVYGGMSATYQSDGFYTIKKASSHYGGDIVYKPISFPAENEVNFSFNVSSFTSINGYRWYVTVKSSYNQVSVYIADNGFYSLKLPASPVDDTFKITVGIYEAQGKASKTYFNMHDFKYCCSIADDSIKVVKSKEFLNGFIVGLASKGKVTQKSISCESGVVGVVLPTTVKPITAETNNNNIEIVTSIVLESEE
jgi:hypothetical protein